jgi:nucleoside-diphosphate-sugar epimerase
MVLSSGRQARQLMDTLRGIAGRVIAPSSIDVYRAFAVVNGNDQGPLQPVPLTEDSELRTGPPYPPERLKMMQAVFPWVDDEYDKIPVERAVLSDPGLPGTVLRLPMVYGPGDPLHRLFPYIQRMDDKRPRILFTDDYAAWRTPRGYVENVAAAIALAATSERAAGRTYIVAEQPAYSEREWAKRIAEQAGWRGELVVLSRNRAPQHLQFPGNFAQHGDASSALIRQELGFHDPVPTEEAIRRTIAWERAHPPAQVPDLHYDAEDAA